MQDYLEDYLEELYENREIDELEETEDAFEMKLIRGFCTVQKVEMQQR